MQIKQFKVAAKDLKENKGMSPEDAERKAKRLLNAKIAKEEERLKLAEFALKKASHDAKVDDLKVEEAKIQLESVIRTQAAAKEEKIEELKEEFDRVWGSPTSEGMGTAFVLIQQINAIEKADVKTSSAVIAAEARLNDLTKFPEVKEAAKVVESIKSELAALNAFKATAFGTETTPEVTAE